MLTTWFSRLAALTATFAAAACFAAACSDDTGGGGSDPGGTGAGNAAACGDGVVDTSIGETCDPPSTCADVCCGAGCGVPVDACTQYNLVGTADTCDVRCEETPITSCDADGCCMAACADDPDCACDASGDCNACFQCANMDACNTEVSACSNSPDCVAFVNCSNACTDAACVQACEAASTPEAVALFQAWFGCVLCGACVNSCMGFGNPAFQGCP